MYPPVAQKGKKIKRTQVKELIFWGMFLVLKFLPLDELQVFYF
jgi:hypothetical protein